MLKEIENKYYKDCNVIMLPTEDITDIGIHKETGKLIYSNHPTKTDRWVSQHVYITVSQDVEPIKESDWCIYNNTVVQATSEDKVYKEYRASTLNEYSDGKIIATTDPKLHICGKNKCTKDVCTFPDCLYPSLQQSFLKKLSANPYGEWEVEYETKKTCSAPHCLDLCDSCVIAVPKLIDNTIVISEVEKKKLYSRKDMIKYGAWRYYDTIANGQLEEDAFDRYIKENL